MRIAYEYSFFNNMAEKLCFLCDQKPRVSGDVVCRSCLQEHRKCYECGENDRNFPFKLCTACYARTSSGSAPPAPPRREGVGIHAIYSVFYVHIRVCIHIYIYIHTDLLRLNTDQQTYKEVNEHFVKEWVKTTTEFPTPPQPLAIFAIQNQKSVETFHKYGDQLRNESSASANSDLFFHGTTLKCDLLTFNAYCSDVDCGICGIAQSGFDSSRIGANIPRFKRFGHGIYLAPNSSKCHDYTQGVEEYGLRAQLLCLVACGAQYELRHDDTELQKPPSQYHSVYGKSGGSLNYDEIVVYNAGAVLPQYVVVYKHNGVHKIAK